MGIYCVRNNIEQSYPDAMCVEVHMHCGRRYQSDGELPGMPGRRRLSASATAARLTAADQWSDIVRSSEVAEHHQHSTDTRSTLRLSTEDADTSATRPQSTQSSAWQLSVQSLEPRLVLGAWQRNWNAAGRSLPKTQISATFRSQQEQDRLHWFVRICEVIRSQPFISHPFV